MDFQIKHWFDDDITIKYLEFIIVVVHPGKKVGLSMYMALDRYSGRVSDYIEKRNKEGHLVLGFINGGITSVLKVCDLVADKEFKALIKKACMKGRAEFLMTERAKTPNDKFRRIKTKIQVHTMTDIFEESTKAFNDGHRTSRSTEKDFRVAGQDPWVES